MNIDELSPWVVGPPCLSLPGGGGFGDQHDAPRPPHTAHSTRSLAASLLSDTQREGAMVQRAPPTRGQLEICEIFEMTWGRDLHQWWLVICYGIDWNWTWRQSQYLCRWNDVKGFTHGSKNRVEGKIHKSPCISLYLLGKNIEQPGFYVDFTFKYPHEMSGA